MTEVAEKQYAEERSIDESEIRELPDGTRAFRVDWGRLSRGRHILPLINVSFVSPDTRVFASVGEPIVPGDTTAGKFIGAADLTMQMVTTPAVGKIDVQVLIDFDVPVACQVDYFVVPRF